MQKISLRKFTSNDLQAFMSWASDSRVTNTLLWDNYTASEKALKYLIEVIESHSCCFAICNSNNVPIGSITLTQGTGKFIKKAELGYVLAFNEWKKGYTTQAVSLICEFAFKNLDLERIEALVDPENIASFRVLEKNYFVREGLLKKYLIHKNELKDRFIYALIKNNNDNNFRN